MTQNTRFVRQLRLRLQTLKAQKMTELCIRTFTCARDLTPCSFALDVRVISKEAGRSRWTLPLSRFSYLGERGRRWLRSESHFVCAVVGAESVGFRSETHVCPSIDLMSGPCREMN